MIIFNKCRASNFLAQNGIRLLSSPDRPTLHRFFDTSPISPSGRYIALFECPFEDELPSPGDAGEVVVFDIVTGDAVFRIKTEAWGTQLGCQAQWGSTDEELCFNVMQEGRPIACIVDFKTGHQRLLDGPIYMLHADRRLALAPDMLRINRLQPGYGVSSELGNSTENKGAVVDDGIWMTHLDTGHTQLLCSFAQIVAAAPEAFSQLDLETGGLYGFHTKWNAQGTRIMFVIRYMRHGGKAGPSPSCLVTMSPDGKDIRIAVHFDEWGRGHHPNWCPDGDTIVMNLPKRGEGELSCVGRWRSRASRLMRKFSVFRYIGLNYISPDLRLYLTRFNYDGTGWEMIGGQTIGSGHPSMDVNMRYVLTDAYPRESVAKADGRVPIRWIDVQSGAETALAWLRVIPRHQGPLNVWRVDPHPVFSPDFRWIVFNAAPEGRRQVFVCPAPNMGGTR